MSEEASQEIPKKILDLVMQSIDKKNNLLNAQDVLRRQHDDIGAQLETISQEISSIGYLIASLVVSYPTIPDVAMRKQAEAHKNQPASLAPERRILGKAVDISSRTQNS